MTTYNRSEIMKAAWSLWRTHYDARPHLKREFEIEEFGFYLAVAWRNAKEALMTATQRRKAAIAAEIDGLKFRSLRVDTQLRRRVLEAELASLAG